MILHLRTSIQYKTVKIIYVTTNDVIFFIKFLTEPSPAFDIATRLDTILQSW